MGVDNLDVLKDQAGKRTYCICPPGSHDPNCILHND